jgi:hypothetical protein
MKEKEERIEIDDVSAQSVVGTFQADIQLTQQRRLTITGHLYDNDSPQAVNRRIDIYQDALDRQYIRCDLVSKRAQRENILAAIEEHVRDLTALRVSQGGEDRPKITSQQRELLKRGDESIERHRKSIQMLDALIAAAEAKIGMAV